MIKVISLDRGNKHATSYHIIATKKSEKSKTTKYNKLCSLILIIYIKKLCTYSLFNEMVQLSRLFLKIFLKNTGGETTLRVGSRLISKNFFFLI